MCFRAASWPNIFATLVFEVKFHLLIPLSTLSFVLLCWSVGLFPPFLLASLTVSFVSYSHPSLSIFLHVPNLRFPIVSKYKCFVVFILCDACQLGKDYCFLEPL